MDLDRKYEYSAEERNTICIILSTVVVDDFLCIERINYMNYRVSHKKVGFAIAAVFPSSLIEYLS